MYFVTTIGIKRRVLDDDCINLVFYSDDWTAQKQVEVTQVGHVYTQTYSRFAPVSKGGVFELRSKLGDGVPIRLAHKALGVC